MTRLLTAALLLASLAQAKDLAAGYDKQLKELDPALAKSFCEARATLRNYMPQADPDSRARMFRSLREFFQHPAASTYTDDQAVDRHWLECGFVTRESEGTVYLTVAPATLLEFVSQLPGDLGTFINFITKEEEAPIAEDAALLITWEQLRETLERWESFAREHPTLAETKSEVEPRVKDLVQTYVAGMANTPAFDYSTGLVDLELIQSWKIYVDRNKASRYHSLIQSLLERVEKRGGRIGASDGPLFEKLGISPDVAKLSNSANP